MVTLVCSKLKSDGEKLYLLLVMILGFQRINLPYGHGSVAWDDGGTSHHMINRSFVENTYHSARQEQMSHIGHISGPLHEACLVRHKIYKQNNHSNIIKMEWCLHVCMFCGCFVSIKETHLNRLLGKSFAQRSSTYLNKT